VGIGCRYAAWMSLHDNGLVGGDWDIWMSHSTDASDAWNEPFVVNAGGC